MSALRKALAVFLSLLLPLQTLAQSNTANDLPDIGSPASSTLSLDDEYRIGLQVVRQLRDEGQIIRSEERRVGKECSSPRSPYAQRITRPRRAPTPRVLPRASPGRDRLRASSR